MDMAGWKTDMMRVYFHRASAASAKLAKFRPEGVGTLAGYTPGFRGRKRGGKMRILADLMVVRKAEISTISIKKASSFLEAFGAG